MLIIRLIHLKDLPSYEGVLNLIEKNDHKQTSGDVVVEKKRMYLKLVSEPNLSFLLSFKIL